MVRRIPEFAGRAVASALLVAVSALPSGCCTLARLWCGPDRSEWVSERYETAEQALATFQESLRRADRQTLFRSLSEDFKRREQLDPIAIEVAWRRLTEQVRGVHLLGTAAVTATTDLSPDARQVTLTVAGRNLTVLLVRQPYWEVRWTGTDGSSSDGSFVRSLHSHARIEAAAPGESELKLTIPPIAGSPPIDAVTFAGIGVEWKVDRIDEASAGGH